MQQPYSTGGVPLVLSEGQTIDATPQVQPLPLGKSGNELLTGQPPVTWASSNGTPIGTATTTDVVTAPSAGHHLEIWFLHASNAGATSCKVGWKEASGTQIYETQLPQNGVISKNINGAWALTTATKLQLVTDAAGSIYWTVGTRTVAD